MSKFAPGQKVIFFPKKGGQMQAVVDRVINDKLLSLRIANDPFPVPVKKKQVSACNDSEAPVQSKSKVRNPGTKPERERQMASTGTKPKAKELRIEARGLGIEDYEEMDRSELVKAIKKAKKAQNGTGSKNKGAKKVSRAEAEEASRERAKAKKSGKKATSKKAAPKSAAKAKSKSAPKGRAPKVSEGNPFRPGSNLSLIHDLLVKGGKRETLAKKLSDKISIHPYTHGEEDIDLVDYDKRVVLCAQTLRDDYNYKIERDGRGLNGTIKATPPKGKARK